jgi:predicted PhzF superfamily epimerase YddE/YHI9
MTLPLYLVDAFAETPFGGNPAGVCLLKEPRSEAWMQGVAKEMNQAETAFVVLSPEIAFIRWFSPTTEIALCGHATLAAAHVLWESGRLPCGATARFTYAQGRLGAVRAGGLIELDFPTVPEWACDAPGDLGRMLGVPVSYVGRSDLDFLALIEDEEALRRLKPDLRAIAALPARGLIVTALTREPGFDFISRFFAPGSGIDEDPVTGSAHCTLGAFWQARLGKPRLRARQVSPRGGILEVRVEGERTALGGKAFTISRGELLVDQYGI